MRRIVLATVALAACAGPGEGTDTPSDGQLVDMGRTDAHYIAQDAQVEMDSVVDATQAVDQSVPLVDSSVLVDSQVPTVDAAALPVDAAPQPVDAAALPVDAAPQPVDAAIPDMNPPSPDSGVLDFILVRPAANSRTILPRCINGVVFEEFEPPCFRNSRGVSFGEVYAVEYRFRENIGAFTGDLIMDETGGGGYDLSLSRRPGDMTPPSDGCHSLFGGFGQLRYADLEAAEEAGDGRMVGGRDGVIVDPLEGICVIDKTDVYYLNVHVVDERCDAANRNTARCSPIILQDAGSLDL